MIMKKLFGYLAIAMIMIIISGCYSNTFYETQRIKDYPKRDYFERVFVYDRKDLIPNTHAPYMVMIGNIKVKGNDTSEHTLTQKAIIACRELGGNCLKVESYSFAWFGNWELRATAYNLDWGKGKSFRGQIVMEGLTESSLKDVWTNRGTLPYEGVYQAISADNGYKFKVGIIKNDPDDDYYVHYLSGMGRVRSWNEGDIIGIFESTALQGVFLGDWVTLDKYSTSAELVFTNRGSFTVSYTPWNNRNKQDISYIRTFPKDIVETGSINSYSTGSGFLLSTKGYIVTSNHVVENAKRIFVIDNNGSKTRLPAIVSVSDPNNDLSILKVSGLSFGNNSSIPYGFDDNLNKTGESVFCMGYPLTQVMGNEIKVTNGIISSVTGYKGDVSSYQISAPAQPGNSGGPLFNASGNVIGVMNAKISQAENVSYAVKISYLSNLIGLLPDDVRISKINQSSSSLSSMVERFKPAIYIIEVEY